MPIASSQGTTFSFNGSPFSAKNVKRKKSVSLVDVTTLDVEHGGTRVMVGSPIVDGEVITCEYFGATEPDIGGEPVSISCAALGISGNAVCEDFELTAAVGEMIMGTATFRISG